MKGSHNNSLKSDTVSGLRPATVPLSFNVSRLINMQPDISEYIERVFNPEDSVVARELIGSAVLHDGEAADPRCQRAALVGS